MLIFIRHSRGTQRQFSKNTCSEDDSRSRIFGTFVVKFLARYVLHLRLWIVFVRYSEDFVKPRFCSIHFTVILAGLKKIVR